MIQALIGPISSLASTWLEGKVEKSKAKVKADVAKAEAEAIVMQKKATGEIDWDLEMAKGSHNSWKDEWLVVLFSIPFQQFFGDRVAVLAADLIAPQKSFRGGCAGSLLDLDLICLDEWNGNGAPQGDC